MSKKIMVNHYDIFKEKVLKKCQKPARYIGAELNLIRKDWSKIKVKWGLLFPDLYEIGASNLGISVLYNIINKNPLSLCERFYFPAEDAVKIMEQEKIPPLSMENRKAPLDFHILGITLPYELTLTNILKFFELSQISLYARERAKMPLIIGGGALAFNPLPFKDFFDLFVIGDGEDILDKITEILLSAGFNREKFLSEISKTDGIYVPSIHNTKKDKIKKLIVKDLNKYEPSANLVPIVETTFNRFSIEIARGCLRGCRFCFAGYTQRPYRERNLDSIYNYFKKGIEDTGFDEFSPSSLSTSDYSCFSELFHCLYHLSIQKKASISLPSLRVGSVKNTIAEKIKEIRKTGFTIAPESFFSMQKKINKNIDFSKLESDILTALEEGWLNIKLYFMIGIPDENINEIYDLKRFLKDILIKVKTHKANITLSFSTFVPKPHTPLQWERMNGLNEILDKQKILKDLFFKEKKIFLKLHNPYMSILEGIISRGDANLNEVIYNAYKKGSILDAWDERFNFAIWQNAFNSLDMEYENYLKEKPINTDLPWEFIDTGITKEFLLREYDKFKQGEITEDCRSGICNNCGVCDFKEVKNILSSGTEIKLQSEDKNPSVIKKYLIIYTKVDDAVFLGNLDIMRLWHRLLRLSDFKLAYTKGFNPQPKIDTGWALPLGIESYCEAIKIETERPINDKNLEILKSKIIDGINLIDIVETETDKSLDVLSECFQIYCKKPYLFDIEDKIMVKRKDSEKVFLRSEFVTDLEKLDNAFRFKLKVTAGGLKPLEYARKVAGEEVTNFDLIKEKVFIKEIGWFGKRVDD
ncbi:MAG: TIGR03960 family B12-binding radical SAM protein [Proteobacteria bacterium]|nr:TIGR03960 family B12-binding radical SAM protein [Pseudomonadota bacterium]